MALQSMTGFARAEGEAGGASFAWELKSVNGKGLEARLRLPQGLERLEQAVRGAIQRRFARGNVHASLTVTRAAGEGSFSRAFSAPLVGAQSRPLREDLLHASQEAMN